MTVLEHIPPMEEALTAAGFPAMSDWWRSTIERFYSAERRQLVLRVGRRGGKSSTLCRVAVLEALFGEHHVPPGDLGVAAFVSVSRDEANQRLRTIKKILDVLQVRYRPIDHGVELEDRPIAFKTYVATVAGVSGFTCICAVADEVSKWRDADTGANPASEVLGSFRPTMATQPNAKMFLSSSPLGPEDAHAVAFDAGETSFQCVAYATTWEAHPAISEASTHELEPDDRKWRREYLAEPQASALAAFDAEMVLRAIGRQLPSDHVAHSRVLLLDPPAGSSDTYAYAICGWRSPQPAQQPRWPDYKVETPGHSLLVFDYIGGIDQAAKRGFTSDRIVQHVVSIARKYGAVAIHSDQFERFALAALVSQNGYAFFSHSWTAPLKERAVERVRGWLRDDVLCLPESQKLKSEMLAFEERIAPSGALTFRGRQGGHDDYAMLVMLAALCDMEGALRGSPLFEAEREAYRRKLANWQLRMELRGDAGDEAERRAQQIVQERNRIAMRQAIAKTTGNVDWVVRERLAWNAMLYRQQSPVLTPADIAELKEYRMIEG